MARRELEQSPLPFPNGWFAVAWSHELREGDVWPIHYFGEDMVLFRTRSRRSWPASAPKSGHSPSMRRWRARWLVLGLASFVGSTGFATCGGDVPEDETEEEESAGSATIEEEQEDMYRDIDR